MSNQGIKRVVCTISNFAASKNVLCILLNLNYIVEIQPFQLLLYNLYVLLFLKSSYLILIEYELNVNFKLKSLEH